MSAEAAFQRRVVMLLVAGATIRLLLATLLVHHSYDMESVRIVDSALRVHPGAVYETGRWPYAPGLFPWVLVSGSLARLTGADISIWFKLPSIAADLGIAVIVQGFLGLRGVSYRARLLAAALVCLGPSFIAISGYEGQIDALAMLPAVAALYAWERLPGGGRRELVTALLIGIGGAIKTVPLLMVLVFLPLLGSWTARVRFAAIAAAVPLAALLPWLVRDPHSLSVLDYAGLPGAGALSLVLQPTLAKDFLTAHGGVRFSALSQHLHQVYKPVLAAALGALSLLLLVRRLRPERAAALLWLTVYVFMPNFFFQYAIWGLPVFLMAGYARQVAIAQALLLVPTVLWEGRTWNSDVVIWPYGILMTLSWVAVLASLGVVLVRSARVARDSPGAATSPS